MEEQNTPDEKTLALLVAISELAGQNRSVNDIEMVYKKSLERARERLKYGEQPYTFEGF